ncbi:MAG: hypothetical protein VR64_02870 [Desulfatitalea sp. BRH_c12]|nr:MAG: hypothetical protein VR64_02870 [Desulfatitalea sp. BRH_c12]
MTSFAFETIGRIHSCFTEKFGIPRQPNLVPEACAVLELLPGFQHSDAFRELEGFSHIWLIFVFHQCHGRGWKTTVRPPRLGGNRRVGVFASRSGFRPNPIGQSVVRLVSLENRKEGSRLHLSGIDLLDGTPVLDIKPYLPYADSLPDARAGYAVAAPAPKFQVVFSELAAQACRSLDARRYPDLPNLIRGVLAQDPRPSYRPPDDRKSFGMRLWDLNVRFRIEDHQVVVTAIDPVSIDT